MSLGIQLHGQLGPESPLVALMAAENAQALLDDLHSWAEGWKFAGRKLTNGQLIVTAHVHPGIEDAIIQITPGHPLMLRAKTTPAGPGYHQFVVGFAEKLAEQYQLEWLNTEAADATGFFKDRDVAALEEQFVTWLNGMAKFVAENPVEKGCVSMNLPYGIRVEQPSGYATPMGPRDQTWIAELLEDTSECALDFFSWWHPEQDASYYQGVALTLGWNFVVWREPRTEKERSVMAAFVEACAKAVELDPHVEIPRQGWMECCKHLNLDVPQEALREDAIGPLGYRRGWIHFPISAGWSILLPGSFSQELAANNVWRGWEEDREVRVQIFPLQRPGAVEEILPRMKAEPKGQRFNAKNTEIGFYGVGDCFPVENGDKLQFETEYLCKDSVLALAGQVPGTDLEWVKGLWESVRRR